ncbi:MAG: lipid-A-disaccharide synthase [Gemmatimonadaceae bacterium]|jgi:lipid-A-disaccharide synthase|nr:lipid-A-disaccharide synthase [Gemmatimonadaceae bacterium]
MREVLIVAGEVSGDLHAAGVARALHALAPALAMTGIGSTRMAAAGVELLERSEQLQVMGFMEAVRHLPSHWSLMRRLEARLATGTVRPLVLLDYPGFNLRLAERAHRRGVPVLYYITPQVWAWGAKRLETMRRVITKAAVILPFEQPLLRAHGIDATFVGHPLLDHVAQLPTMTEARAQLGLPAEGPVLALFPGSRAGEIARHLDAFVATARLLHSRVPGLTVVVSVAPGIAIDRARCPYVQVEANSFAVLRAATASLCKSGTNTLEAAVAGCPHILAYRAAAVSYAIAKRVVRVPHIGLVNLVAERELSHEFIQDAVVPAHMADALAPLLDAQSAERVQAIAALSEVRTRLGTPGASTRVATMALELAA